MAPAVAGVVSAAISAAGTAYYQHAAGQQRKAAAKANQRKAEEAAANARLLGIEAVQRKAEQVSVFQGKIRSAVAYGGAVLGEGTPLKLELNAATLGKLDQEAVKNNYAGIAWGYENQAMNFGYQADAANLATWGAGLTLIAGAGETYAQYKALNPKKTGTEEVV